MAGVAVVAYMADEIAYAWTCRHDILLSSAQLPDAKECGSMSTTH